MVAVRRLNEQGIARLLDFIHRVKSDSTVGVPVEILTHPETSSDLGDVEIDVEQRTFGSRFIAAEYLNERFADCGLKNIDEDRGLWAWLALFYFEELCPIGKSGKRSAGEDARWVLNPAAFRYYRHLLLNPYRIFRAHRSNPECARILLCNPLHEPGDMVGQLASRQELVTNASLLDTATRLYLNPTTGRAKRGAGNREQFNGKSRGKPGTIRRLVDVWRQFDVTWDMYAMNVDEIMELLPKEFARFKQS